MAKTNPLYESLMKAIEYHRVRAGLSMVELEEAAGLSEGYFSKMLHAGSADGRRASLDMMQKVVDVLFAGGRCGVRLMEREGNTRQPSMEKINRGLRTHFRAYLMQLGRLGARRRNERLTPEQRGANARHAARVRWQRKRLEAERKAATPASLSSKPLGNGRTPRALDRGRHATVSPL
jgi:hypothetical protein